MKLKQTASEKLQTCKRQLLMINGMKNNPSGRNLSGMLSDSKRALFTMIRADEESMYDLIA